MSELRIGVLGFGTVGGGTVKLLLDNAALIQNRTGVSVRLVRIASKPLNPERAVELEVDLDAAGVELTDDVDRVLDADDVDVVIELIGGYEPARTFVERALKNGKHVVTANKALIAVHGNELLTLAREKKLWLGFEAAVAGAVPVVKAVRESLAANQITEIFGILNGTCNYILTEMRAKGLPFDQVLAAAQEKGYAEADPSFDVDGVDAAHKITILASLAFGTPLRFDDVSVEGVRHVSDVDIAWASRMGYRIKLLAIARRAEDGLELSVQPVMIPEASMVAAVEGVFNAVFVQGDFSDMTMYYGRGAGEKPTASAVVADVIDIARAMASGAGAPLEALSIPLDQLTAAPLRPLSAREGKYYLRLMVLDRPGVLAEIAGVLKDHKVSIDALQQPARAPKESVPLVLVTHTTSEQRVQGAIKALSTLEVVQETPRVIQIERSV